MRTFALLSRLRRRPHPAAAPLLLGAAGLAAAALVHFVDPHEPGHYPTCPWLALTGTYCPGCGTMRCVNALTNLDIAGAAQMNILTLAMVPIMGVAYLRWLYRSLRPSARPPRPIHPFWLWTLLVVILAFWVLRNLPFAAFLAPGGVPTG
ncbi:DUF2752 domain-containing protein [Marinitenerispora sediminis]|uniref:DUF2752 domain-containing protein n=1 Tax=Marinitenerispora sediminis TaxID=1931232 RepID=UPI001F3BF280|nr:DUF2752 domain-containing protein [Marinitenerispora sediminis]